MSKNKKSAPLPNQSASAGSSFVMCGIVLACIGIFVIAIELFNDGDFGPMMAGGSGVTFGLLLMVVGYVKQSAVAAAESYYLQRRIYEEQTAATVDPAGRQA